MYLTRLGRCDGQHISPRATRQPPNRFRLEAAETT